MCSEYPEESTYFFGEPITFPDGSVMVEAGVTVEGITHTMRLSVMDNRNKAIQGKADRAISDAQMRCFVKAIAMHGIGMSLYLGNVKTSWRSLTATSRFASLRQATTCVAASVRQGSQREGPDRAV